MATPRGLRRAAPATIVVWVACALGCAGARPAPRDAEPVLEAQQALDAATVYRPGPQLKSYTVSNARGDSAAGRMIRAISEVDDAGGWTIVSGEEDWLLSEGSERVLDLRRTEDGSVELVGMIAPAPNGRGRRVYRFEPALIMMPGSLRAGERFEHVAELHTSALDAGAKDQSGSAKHVTEFLGEQDVRTPWGRRRVQRIRATLQLELGPARVERTRELWVDPVLGIVNEALDSSVRVFGLQVESSSVVMSLAEVDGE